MSDLSSITLPSGTIYNFKDAIARAYGYCTTAAATQAKVVTISGITALAEGLKITVRFQYAQSYNGVPTLNVNSLGAKNILIRDGTNGIRYLWDAGAVLDFTYNGTGWVMENGGLATTTYYGLTKLSSSTSSTSTALAATASAVKAAYDLANQASSASVIKYSVSQISANASAIYQNAESLMASSSTGKPMVLSYLDTDMRQYTIPYVSIEYDDKTSPTERYIYFKGFVSDNQIITVKITYAYNASTAVATYDSYDTIIEESKETFIATYGTTTYNEIAEARAANKVVLMYSGAATAVLFAMNTTIGACFSTPGANAAGLTGSLNFYKCASNNTWSNGSLALVPKTGTTMTGALVAQNNTNYTTAQTRNIILSTAEPTASDGGNGDVWLVYTA